MQRIYLVTTGGSIESTCVDGSGVILNGASQIGQYLKKLRLLDCDVWLVPLTNSGGPEETPVDRANLISNLALLISHGNPIVITHATEAMVETGIHVEQAFPELNVPVILTGVSVPPGVEGSDGLQNLTESIFATRLLKPGVYVVIHGRVYPLDRGRLSEWFRYKNEE